MKGVRSMFLIYKYFTTAQQGQEFFIKGPASNSIKEEIGSQKFPSTGIQLPKVNSQTGHFLDP